MSSKLAYLLLVHADPDHLEKLIQVLDYRADFYIHVDAKKDPEPFQQRLRHKTNIHFIEERYSVAWAGISMIDATLALLRTVMATSESYMRLVLLSGSCFPIKPAPYIYEYFQNRPDEEFINYIDMRESPEHYYPFVKHKWFKEPFYRGHFKPAIFLDKVTRRLMNWTRLKNKWDPTIIPYFGSQWWALTPQVCAYILAYVEQHPAYYEMNRLSFSPDEHFFHSILGNWPEFAARHRGLMPYKGKGTYMANLHIIHHSLAKWYTLEDWPEVAQSEKLFVRKLNSKVSAELIENICQSFQIQSYPLT